MTQRRAGADPVWKAWVHGRWYTGAWHRKASRQMGQLACGGDGDGGGRCPGTGRDHRRGKGQRACGSTRRGGAHHLTSAVEVVRAILCLELRDAQLVYIMSRQPRGGEQHQAQNKGSRDQGIKRSRSKLSSAISGSCPPPLLDCPLDLLLFWYYFWGLLWLHFRQETRKHGDKTYDTQNMAQSRQGHYK